LIPVVVQPGDTLSGIAAQYGTSYQAIAAASGIANPNLIYAGQTVEVPTGGVNAPAPTHNSSPSNVSYTPSTPTPAPTDNTVTGGGQFSIPGMSQSMASCIAFRESTNDTNPAANGNVFGIIPASGYNVAGDSVAQQEQVAGQIYAQSGGQAWAADGCPGT
jgi:murein DD-endopeptidase MepM/ murein hydrolase activator NlpD